MAGEVLEEGQADEFLERGDLFEGKGVVGDGGGGEVRVDADDLEAGKSFEVLQKRDGGVGADAGALHAGLHFEVDAACAVGFFGDDVGFELGTDGELEAVANEVVDLVFVNGAEDEDGDRHTGEAEADALLQARDAEVIDAEAGGEFTDADEAVAVGVGFDGEAEEALADLFADGGDVLFKLSGVDLNPGGVGIVFHDLLITN